jgi:LuxR family maltose regulon positive regulatory protein
VARIEDGSHRRLTLIVAPAGWGKTSLLAEWMATTTRPVVWLPLASGDDEPTRLLRQLALAINRTFPGLADDVLAMLRSPYLPGKYALFSSLIDVLQWHNTPFTLVIDDVHHIVDEDVRDALRRLIGQLPDGISVVLSGRAEPALNISRWRVQGEVTELRLDDMRFTATEAREFFAAVPGVHVGEGGIAAILDRTEGWAAGLRLAAILLRGRAADADQFADFRGTQREVAAFLCEEVLNCQTDEMRTFLMQAAVFDDLTAPLCDAAMERTDSQAMLERAVDDGLFLTPVDAARQSFRMHPLFRDYLRAELGRADPGREPDLHRRAAAWLSGQDAIMEAIDQLIAAGDPVAAAPLIDRLCDRMVLTSEYTNTFVRWVEALPANTIVAHPRMLRFYVQALTLTGRLADAETFVHTMIAHPYYRDDPANPDNNQRQAELLAVQSRLAAYRGENRQTIDLATAALALIGTTDPAWQASLELDLGFASRTLGDLDAAARHFATASRIGWNIGSFQPALWGTRYLALTLVAQGRLREAIAMIEGDLERARDGQDEVEAIQACLLIAQGELRYETCDLPGARAALEAGLRLAQRSSDAKILMNGYVALAQVEQAEGHLDTAMLMLRRGTRIFSGPQEAAVQAGVALAAGQTASALHWARESGMTADDDLLPERGPAEQVTFAKVLLATGDHDRAVPFLERLLAAVMARGWLGRAIELQVVLAVACAKAGHRDRALAMIGDAVRIAAPEGYVREFVESGPEATGLLRDLMRSRHDRDHDIDREFVTRVLAFSRRSDAPEQVPGGMLETLTERQMDVLRLLAAGKSNRAIAAELFLAEGTVKAHVFQICAKLMARNRTEAVARARSLGLV